MKDMSSPDTSINTDSGSTGKASRIALGTAQFGLNYGLAGRGRVGVDLVAQVLRLAAESGVNTLDTAMSYGSSESVLGSMGIRKWRVITKLPGIPLGTREVERWVMESVEKSLHRLGVTSVYGLLLHRPGELIGAEGAELVQALDKVQVLGLAEKVGVSVYSPSELNLLIHKFPNMTLVQAPYNVLDQRLELSGWLQDLHSRGIEVHVRSTFLQGLLLMDSGSRPKQFSVWQDVWRRWDEWIAGEGISRIRGCFARALGDKRISRIVVGIDNPGQFRQILDELYCEPIPPVGLACNDELLINPSKWEKQ